MIINYYLAEFILPACPSLLQFLQQKESVADITADEKQCLITYYAQLRPKRWQEWEHTYVSLTTTQYIFLILQEDLHYDDDTIAQILGVKPASLRTLRSRIK